MTRILAPLALAVLLCSCKTGFERPLTPKEFYGYCWPQQMNICWDDNLCDQYRQYLEMQHASKADCIKGCNELQTMKYREDSMRGCMGAINNATDWCEKYCRLYFDYGPPSRGGQGRQ